MSTPHLPWEPNFTAPGVDPNLINQVAGVIQGATQAVVDEGAQIGGQLAGQDVQTAITNLGKTATSAEQAVTSVVASAPGGGAINAGVSSVIEAAAAMAIKEAQGQIIGRVQTAITDALGGLGAPPVATIPAGDLRKIDAWERAGRTFLMGLLVTILAGIVQVIGQAATAGQVDFFSKSGWIAVGTLAIGSVVTSVFSYILRYLKEPAGAAVNSSTKS